MKKIYFLLLFSIFAINCAYAKWNQIGSGSTVNCIFITGSFPSNRIYIGVPNSTQGVYYSANFGDTWNGNDWYPYYATCNSIIQGGSKIIAGTDLGILLSSDISCSSWTRIYTLNGEVYSFVENGGTIYAGTEYGVNSTTDNGSHWNTCNHVDLNYPVYSLAINNTSIYAGTDYGIYYSSNSGGNWSLLNTGIPANGSVTVKALAINGSQIYAGTTDGIFRSADNGSNWTIINTGLTNNNVPAIAVSGTKIFASIYGDGVYISTDNGNSWAALNDGFSHGSEFYVNSLVINGSLIFAGGDGTWWRSTTIPNDIEEIGIDNSRIIISPNPSAGKFTIENKGDLYIYNLTGQQIHSQKLTLKRTEIDLSIQPKGVYFLKISDQDKIYTQKIVIW
ncbi:MAG: T9SS type A sorting domain-containing protein [Bacteroidota bacterium]